MPRHEYECAGGVVHDVEALWRLTASVPVQKVPVRTLEKQLDDHVWSEGNAEVSPREVMSDPPHRHPGHWKRIEACKDVVHPILLKASDNSVVDGMHRLAYAVSWAHEFINARYVTDAMMRQAAVKDRPTVHTLELYGLKEASVVWTEDSGAVLSCDGPGISYVYGDGRLSVRNEQFGRTRDARLSLYFKLEVHNVELFGTSFNGIAEPAVDLRVQLTMRVDAASALRAIALPGDALVWWPKIVAYNGCTMSGDLFNRYRPHIEMHGGQVINIVGHRAAVPLFQAGPPALLVPASLPSPPVFRLSDVLSPPPPPAAASFVMPAERPCTKAADDSAEQCKICMDNRADCGLGGCSHKVCFECLSKQREKGLATCPFCRAKITKPKRLPPKRKIQKT